MSDTIHSKHDRDNNNCNNGQNEYQDEVNDDQDINKMMAWLMIPKKLAKRVLDAQDGLPVVPTRPYEQHEESRLDDHDGDHDALGDPIYQHSLDD